MSDQMKQTMDVHQSINRTEKLIDSRLDTPAERGSAATALDELRDAVNTHNTHHIQKAIKTTVQLAPSEVLDAIQPALQEAKWYVYDRTGKELATRRIN